MLKKVIPILAVLSFAWSILFISLFKMGASVPPLFAAAGLKFSVSPQVEVTSSASPKVEYYLVYPGMLPDHPFYKIKMIRDQIWLALTTEPIKRTELLLLFADKRIGAGEVLIKGNKVELGMSTLTKGVKYFERAVSEESKAKQKGRNTNQTADKLRKASLKYDEVLTELGEKVNPDGKTYLENLLKLIKNLRETSLTL